MNACVCRIREVQMLMWKEGNGNRRRSPRISGLNVNANPNACDDDAQQTGRVKKVDRSTKSTTANGAGAAAVAVGRVNGPASRARARKKRKLKPLQDVAAAATTTITCVSPIAQHQQQSQDHNANGVEDGEEQNHEHHPRNSDKPLALDDDSHQDQPSSLLSASWMPEKHILELILDTLQRKDTHEIFAEPVDPEEVEDYYEIIKEPMDFGTMRAKLHEGMYKSLEQFEHDVFLISGNAMHFNSSSTIYFRQARIIHELSKKVFHALKTDPDNFELEFSETRQRTGRRWQSEAKGPIYSSIPKPATNLRTNSMSNVSSKTMPYSLSGSANLKKSGCYNVAVSSPPRDNETLSGARDGRRASFSEADRRSTYIPLTSFLNGSDSIVSPMNNNSKTLKHVNQQDIGYRESLMLFVKDLGPTAQMIAKRKLHGLSAEASDFQTSSSNCCFPAPQCHNPSAFASAKLRPTVPVNTLGHMISQNLLEHCHGHQTVLLNSSDRTNLCGIDKMGKACTDDRMDIRATSVEATPKSEKKTTTAFKDIHISGAIQNVGGLGSDNVHKTRNNGIMLGSNSSTAMAMKLNFLVAGLNFKGGMSVTMNSEKSKLDNQAQSSESTLEYSQSNSVKFSMRNSNISSSWPLQTTSMSTSQTKGSRSNLGSQCIIRDHDQAIATQGQSRAVISSPGASQPSPLVSQFTFDLPYLKTRLDQINTSRQDSRLLQQFQGTGGSFLEKMNYQKLDNHQQSSLDPKHTDLILQL